MRAKWSWVKGGLILGLWNILIFLSGNHLGTTTAYAQTTGYLTQFFTTAIPANAWTAGTCGTGSVLSVGWQWYLVLGIFLGGLTARLVHGKQKVDPVPKLWQERFGFRPRLRYLHALVGGFLLLLGARIAGGCTSSHVISGMSQLAVSGLLFGGAVFAAGIPVALLLYRKGDAR
ncbi:MAG TPA: YeeE/YedE family protein [Firmicutes bacterium]|uniref:YeeE/YedE family protein n=1 Tax=Capillibacterium thermochitinicola TaxID=2699427 RepID=A0A8J6HZT4_9FIRM|nr:YeeE/YedE thiosulfate transporter family protein [Capillibacterium thermochitinicola]MBA2132960.1 YeeE/YedE family protein [Capillibacterium thermochitinicola]HHW12733.1 YeeE/YedE family protein [Bacillota bacterium]